MPDFFDLIASRQSCRAYTGRPVERDALQRCLEAACLAPSACNAQPWSFVAVQDAALAAQTAKALQGGGMNRFTDQCGTFVAIVEEKGNLSARFGARIKGQDYTSIDIGIAAAHFCLAATALGLSTCIIGWFDEGALKGLLDIDAQKRVRLVLCVGYTKDEAIRAKDRKPFADVVTYR